MIKSYLYISRSTAILSFDTVLQDELYNVIVELDFSMGFRRLYAVFLNCAISFEPSLCRMMSSSVLNVSNLAESMSTVQRLSNEWYDCGVVVSCSYL